MNEPDWDAAACRGKPTTWWFPAVGGVYGTGGTKHTSRNQALYAQARAVCDDCPIRTDCLHHALTLPEYHGMWGGLTERERRAIRRQPKPRRPT